MVLIRTWHFIENKNIIIIINKIKSKEHYYLDFLNTLHNVLKNTEPELDVTLLHSLVFFGGNRLSHEHTGTQIP